MRGDEYELNWRWFMAVDFDGNWITINGGAHLEINSDKISGFMCLQERHDDTSDIYAEFSANLSGESSVDMTISSRGKDVPPFQVSGSFYTTLEAKNSAPYTLILTDGTTVVGFTQRRSEKE